MRVLTLKYVFITWVKDSLSEPDLFDPLDLHLIKTSLPKILTLNAYTYVALKLVVYSQARGCVKV